MKKKTKIIIFIVIIIIAIFVCIIKFKDFRQEVSGNTYKIEKEIVLIEKPKSIKVSYHYGSSDVGIEIDMTDEEIINELVDAISNNELNNETKAGLMLEIIGKYEIDFGNGKKIKFDRLNSEYIKICDKEKEFITKIELKSPLKKIGTIIDKKLTEDAKMFNTDKITVTNIENKKVDITRKTALEYILKECKDIGVKQIEDSTINEKLKYKINFNNGIEIIQYDGLNKGTLIENSTKYEVYGLEVLYKILEFAFYDSEEKDKMFSADKIIIESSSKSIEITDKDIIEKITTPIVYSDLQERDYISNRDIEEEYNNAIKVKINDYELLVSDKNKDTRMGDRYIIYPDKTRKMYFLLEDIEDYVNELLY